MPASFAEIFLEAMRYEHWLRFYFADDPEGVQDEDSQDAVIRVPAEFMERSRSEDAELVDILDALQEKLITMEASRDAVFANLGRRSGFAPGSEAFDEQLVALSADMDFRRSLDWFNAWVQEIANNEIDLQGNALPPGAPRDERIVPFAEWQAAFNFWYSLQKPLGEIAPGMPS